MVDGPTLPAKYFGNVVVRCRKLLTKQTYIIFLCTYRNKLYILYVSIIIYGFNYVV